MTQRRSEPVPDRYFGQGKLEETKAEIARTGANEEYHAFCLHENKALSDNLGLAKPSVPALACVFGCRPSYRYSPSPE